MTQQAHAAHATPGTLAGKTMIVVGLRESPS